VQEIIRSFVFPRQSYQNLEVDGGGESSAAAKEENRRIRKV
jgi:hypothetical protein